uniref:SAP domain-containing protein n=1 Tax=Macrostomum lignano TaxID=282301 RepID=A0A1I8G0Z6_9PLAT
SLVLPATNKALREALSERGLPTNGNKQELTSRLKLSIAKELERQALEQDRGSSRRAQDDKTSPTNAGAPELSLAPPEDEMLPAVGASAEGRAATGGGLEDQLRETELRIRLLDLKKREAQLEAELAEARHSGTAAARERDQTPGEWHDLVGECILGQAGAATSHAQAPAVYRVVDFISERKRRQGSQSVVGAAKPERLRHVSPESLSFGDFISGSCNLLVQMLRDGKLLRIVDGRIDSSELIDHLRHNARIGDLLDLGFDRTKVMRYDDECRLLQHDGTRWSAVSADLGLVATHLMAPTKMINATAPKKRTQPPVCFDFNSLSGCNRTHCRFAHQCRSSTELSSDLVFAVWREELAGTEMPEDRVRFVLDGVKNGFRITNKVMDCKNHTEMANHRSATIHQQAVEAQVRQELKQDRYRRCQAGNRPLIVSALGRLPATPTLGAAASSLLAAAYAPQSRRAISSAVRSWHSFCNENGTNPARSDRSVLLNYLAHLVECRLRSFNSLRVHVSALSSWFKACGAEDLTKHHLVSLLVRGAKRRMGQRPRRKLPISPAMLLSVKNRLNSSSSLDRVCWLVTLIAWWGMFRRSSLLPSQQSASPISVSAFQRHPKGVVLSVSYGKTNQFGAKLHRVLLPRLKEGHPLCPVAALEGHLRVSKLGCRQPVFSYQLASGSSVVLSASRFDRFLKRCLATAEQDARSFSAHSLRRGGATWAYRLGLSVQEVKCIGDWRSDAVTAYLPSADSVRAGSRFAGAFNESCL